jgi:hypothetical protein
MKECFQRITACAAVWLSCVTMTLPADAQQQLNIVVLEGQGAINNIQLRASRDLAVQVEDENHQPLAGASVVFTLPSQGSSGSFVHGDKTLVVTTDAQGKAVAHGMTPNKVAGKMEIRVNASYQGKTASVTITQFNMAVQNTQKSGSSKKWVAILLVAGAAGAAGAVLGTRGSSPPSTSTPPPTPSVISISPGPGSVGAPQ